MMITDEKLEKPDWASKILQVQGSVVPAVAPRVLAFCALAALVSGLHTSGLPIYLEKLGDLTTNVIYNLVLGLLIVFRTNTSYDRFWDGRKALGAMVIHVRNLAQEMQVGIAGSVASSEKQAMIRLLSAFSIATKLHLRNEEMSDELRELLTPEQCQQLEESNHRPLVIIFWLRRYLQQQLTLAQIADSRLIAANDKLSHLVEGVTSCERIITTPIPIAYRIFLRRLILIYCIGLPFRIVPDLGWWSILIMAAVSFLLLGVEEVGRELENPFGYTANDLPLDDICAGIIRAVESTVAMGCESS